MAADPDQQLLALSSLDRSPGGVPNGPGERCAGRSLEARGHSMRVSHTDWRERDRVGVRRGRVPLRAQALDVDDRGVYALAVPSRHHRPRLDRPRTPRRSSPSWSAGRARWAGRRRRATPAHRSVSAAAGRRQRRHRGQEPRVAERVGDRGSDVVRQHVKTRETGTEDRRTGQDADSGYASAPARAPGRRRPKPAHCGARRAAAMRRTPAADAGCTRALSARERGRGRRAARSRGSGRICRGQHGDLPRPTRRRERLVATDPAHHRAARRPPRGSARGSRR